jgi:cytochrome c oxidase cbb3-type subunit III
MTAQFTLGVVLLGATLVMSGCTRGQPKPGSEVPRPDEVLDSALLYRENCAGCHGAQGKYGPAMALSNSVYQALVDDETLRTTISKGRAGTAMSAFAQKEGGMLTDRQIDSVIRGIRERWSKHDTLSREERPSYAASTPGNPQQGQAVYATFCSSCHGVDGKGGTKAGSIVNWAYLSLISDQGLRTIVITGRPDFDAPDWRGNIPGRPMTEQDITDVVAWLASHRPKQPRELSSANVSLPGNPK